MTLERVDTLVVGAGPAGSAAATALARAGNEVVLCERSLFPRDKPCGDLIGVRALAMARQLGVTEDELAPYPSLAGALVSGGDRIVDLSAGGPTGRFFLRRADARVIPRAVFDDALARAAVRAGARLRQLTVRDVGPWDVRSSGRVISAQSPYDGPVKLFARGIVIAGGYGCRIASDFLPGPRRDTSEPSRGIAMRGYLEGVSGLEDRIAFCLDDWLLPGYGWIFPLPGGRANVGVGTLVRAHATASEHLRDLYDRFVTDPLSPASPYLKDAASDATPRSWPLDLGPRRRRLTAPGLVVAGEAAALVGPLTGAGIAFALVSGYRAGEALAAALIACGDADRPLHSYARRVHRRTLPWLRSEAFAQRWLSEPAHVRGLLSIADNIPGGGAIGAGFLLHLG